jgi:putative DNA methylase
MAAIASRHPHNVNLDTSMTVKSRKKLIEVALPLEAINAASAREKSIRHGHPSTLHLWWARRPLAAARAVIFAQMVDDPPEYVNTLLGITETRRAAERELKKRRELWEKRKAEFEAGGANVPEPGPEPTLEDCAADIERKRLFGIIEELVKWENTTNEEVLEKARAEIWQSWRRACADNAGHPCAKELFDRNRLPAFHDPFAGGGALPLEAQRLGLEAYASDLNPVAVLINKAMIEIPPKFAGRAPVNPAARAEKTLAVRQWRGAQGLAEDVRYYGQWMRDEAEKRIGHLYPKVEVTAEMAKERPDLKPYVGRKLTVIAWLWARTVKSPNPAFRNVDVPLASTFMLSTKAGKEAYVEPVIENGGYRFTVKVGKPKNAEAAKLGTTAGKRAAFRCLMSDVPVSYDHIREQGKAGLMGARLMAIVAEGERGRVYLSPTEEHEEIARRAKPEWKPDMALPDNPRDFKTPNYGLTTFGDLFTARQLVALNTFSDLVLEAREKVKADAEIAFKQLAIRTQDIGPGRDAPSKSYVLDTRALAEGGTGAQAYADAVAVYLGLACSRATDAWASQVSWRNGVEATRGTFARQALPMIWDFAEANPFSLSCGNWDGACLDWVIKALDTLPTKVRGLASQQDAATQVVAVGKIVSTDPPYYDNIGYADLSDFFYVWLRRTLRPILPDLFGTMAVPKAEELVATPYRHGSKEAAEAFFLDGMTKAMHRLAEQAHPAFPTTIYYAFKQSETDGNNGTASTGWETFLDAAIRAGFALSGTWPMRTERGARSIGIGTNALASSIILVCRPRAETAATATRRDFLNALKAELPAALAQLQRGNIAPVDLAQAAIGPGMAMFTRYAKVVDAEGKQLSVREALALINQVLDEVLAEQEGDFDADSRFAIAWFEQYGFNDGEFGVADVLARAKNTAVSGLVEAGIAHSRGGRVRLLRPDELPADWDPAADPRLTIWETVHHLIRALESGGEAAAAGLAAKLGPRAEVARELAYRLYVIAERKKRAAEALAYNGLVQSWPEIMRLAREAAAVADPAQAEMFA